MGIKEFLATKGRDEHGNSVPNEAEYARAEKRRSAWITFAAAALEGMLAEGETGGSDKTYEWAAGSADAILAELDKRDFSGGG